MLGIFAALQSSAEQLLRSSLLLLFKARPERLISLETESNDREKGMVVHRPPREPATAMCVGLAISCPFNFFGLLRDDLVRSVRADRT